MFVSLLGKDDTKWYKFFALFPKPVKIYKDGKIKTIVVWLRIIEKRYLSAYEEDWSCAYRLPGSQYCYEVKDGQGVLVYIVLIGMFIALLKNVFNH